MAIVKRELKDGIIVGYNTKTNSYCELPSNEELAFMAEDEETEEANLLSMSVEELQEYAEGKGIDLGGATSQNGMIKKIKEALEK